MIQQRAFQDFRDVLEHFEQHGRLMRIQSEVGLDDFKIPSAVRASSDDPEGPAYLFEHIRDRPGWRVAGAIFANRRNVALSLGIEERDLVPFFQQRVQGRIPPRRVSDGPVQEIVLTGDDVDLLSLPIPVHSELDRGHLINGYISGDLLMARVPGTELYETAIVRIGLLSRNTLTVFRRAGHVRRLMNEAEARGEPLHLSAALGFEPALAYASQLFNPIGTVNELDLGGSFKGAPVELVRCRTIDCEAIANAEIVLELVTIPGERRPDGPYGEFHGTYGGSPSVPVARVTAITLRRNAIYQTIMTGVPATENQWIVGPAREAMAWANAQRTGVEIVDLYLTASGAHGNHCVVSIRKRHAEEPRQLIMALLSTGRGMGSVTRVTVVDDDINVHDMQDVDWAIMNRCEPDLDLYIMPGWQSYEEARAHHSTGIVRPGVRGAKWGIDATAPTKGRWAYEKVYVPGQGQVDWRKGERMWDGVDLRRREPRVHAVPEWELAREIGKPEE